MENLREQFIRYFGVGEILGFEASGRVNLIGEHIDYNGGLVLPAALSLKSRVLARRRSDNIIRMRATTVEGEVLLDINRLGDYKNLPWGAYQAGVAFVLQQRGVVLCGCDLLFDCDVPFGSGLSSSAAIEVSTALALSDLAEVSLSLVELAVIGQQAENSFVGVNCGIMDQFASSLGRENHAILLDCNTLEYSYIPLDFDEYSLVIANTKKPRSLIVSKYNERRAECDNALSILAPLTGITALCQLSWEDFDRYKSLLPCVVARRVEHVLGECARVRLACDALSRGDNAAFGQLLVESHQSLKDLYEVTGAELDAMFFAAVKCKGVLGSRMTGAGFGGCTVSLVHKAFVDEFISNVGAEYHAATSLVPEFYIADISSGARKL